MAESDSEGIDHLLGDIDDLDEELFGRKKKTTPKKRLDNLEDIFSKNKEQPRPKRNLNDLLSSASKKPTVSFFDAASTKRKEEQRKATTADGVPSSADEPTRKILLSDAESRRSAGSSAAIPEQAAAALLPRSTSNVDELFGPLQRRSGMPRSRTTPGFLDVPQSHTAAPELRHSTQSSDDLPFLLSGATGVITAEASSSAGQSAPVPDGSFPGYQRVQRLENEINRLNREIDELKQKKKEDEEEIINEWKQKLSKKQREHEEAISELEANHRKVVDRLNEEFANASERLTQNLQRQIEAIGVVQNESRKQELLLSEVQSLTEQIKQIASHVKALNEATVADRQAALSIKEEHLTSREQRLEKEEERLREERKVVDALNIKLESLYERNEEDILKEKWHIRDERNRLNAEKSAFKEHQKYILDTIEKHKAETEAARTAFLSEQHDLLVRMFAEKTAFDEERNAFIIQRDSDIARLKAEAQHLDEKMKQVQDAERLMNVSRQTYQSKYRELAELEQTLLDECVELQQCRAEIEASLAGRVTVTDNEARSPTALLSLLNALSKTTLINLCTTIYAY
ncbi:hypothetical protein Tcan_08441 [Toxocara canis]|uniref:Fas-binding factor 1 C-terminal domain-containing protein n=1 Tax=Toxocara canis TaxID=6265 RepID=A0A0B2VLM1_TOXCA|nr:hypothetical protein Tcan_08441 [Toxocara canis]